jgi:peptide/nickel transport system substrate-binding protein
VEGSADFALNLQMDPATLHNMAAGEYGQIATVPGPLVERILVNFSDPNTETDTGERSNASIPHPFFRDKQVRRAVAHAIDREAIAALYGDTAEATTNILVSPSKYNSPNTQHLYPFDLARAAELLDTAGWKDTDGDGIRDKDGQKMSILFQTSVNTLRQQTQDIVKDALEQIGVEVTLKFIDSSIFFSASPENTNNLWHFYADLQEYYTGAWSPDPFAHWSNLTCDRIPQEANEWKGGGNMGRWCNADYDALIARAAPELDPDTRTQLFIQMNDIVVEEVVLIPLVRRVDTHGVSNTLEGIEFTPWDATTWKIQEWKRR